MSCESLGPGWIECTDEDGNPQCTYPWLFDQIWWYLALALCIAFTIYPIYDFIINKSRETPSKLMLGRLISNFCQALVFLSSIKSEVSKCTPRVTCDILGALFTMFLIISALYYTTICIDLYLTLRNPFRKPVSNSAWVHFVVILAAVLMIIPIGSMNAFEYRDDFQFCWTSYKPGFNFWNLFIVYVPVASVVIGGILVSYWSLKRLKSRILDDTFELRWKIIKRQTAIVGCFTVAYFCQGILWLMTFAEWDREHVYTPTRSPPQPYLLSVFVLCGVFFDLITWCAKDSITVCWKSNKIVSSHANIYDETETAVDSMNNIEDRDREQIIEVELHKESIGNKPYQSPGLSSKDNRPVTARTGLLNQRTQAIEKLKKKDKSLKLADQNQTLSNALRKEVVTFITAGLVQGLKVTAWETNKNTEHGNTFDDDFDREGEYGGGFREDTDTHPALQLFQQSNPARKDQPNKQKHFPKAQSYAGFLIDRVSGRKRSKSYENRRSTDSTNGLSGGRRHHKGSSFQYSARIGKTSTVAVSIPIGLGHGQYGYDVKERRTQSTISSHSDLDCKESDVKYTEYNTNYSRDFTAKRETMGSTNDSMSSSSNVTPEMSVSPNISNSESPMTSPLDDRDRMVMLGDTLQTDQTSVTDSFNNEDDATMNAEDGGDWNETNQTLEFDVGPGNNDIYSQSLLATPESEPPFAYYPQSTKLQKASTNKGTVNRFNIGIAGSDRVSFTDYAPHVFRYLRNEIYKVSDRNYLQSIFPPHLGGDFTKVSELIIAKFSEGRSGAFFFFSPDNKYVIKTLTKEEAQLLIDTLYDYVQYVKLHRNRTYLTRYFGLHSVKLYGKVIYFMVSGNIFPSDGEIMEKYDIKGSWIDRHTNRHLFEKALMKDEDLHRNLQLDPITSSNIHNQLTKDTMFLQKHNIMDYSLLLGISYRTISNSNQDLMKEANNFFNKKPYNFGGVDENTETDYESKMEKNVYSVKANKIEGPGTYFIGIIDMLQKWNQEKKGERFLKVYFRCKNQAGISCVEPVFYRKRFLVKMQQIGM